MEAERRIIKNTIQCKRCGDIIVSTDVHSFVTCECGACSADGGNEYLRRAYKYSKDDIIELSEYKNKEA